MPGLRCFIGITAHTILLNKLVVLWIPYFTKNTSYYTQKTQKARTGYIIVTIRL